MKRILICVGLLLCLASGQVFGAAVQVEALWNGLRDNSNEPLSSGLVYTYTAGTANAKSVYLDSAKAIPAANPVVLNAYGRATVYADGVYKFIIKSSDGVTLATLDNLTYADPTTVTTTAFSNITSIQATIASLTSSNAYLNDSTISSSTWNNGYINGAVISNPTISSATISDAVISSATISTVTISNATISAAANLDMNAHRVVEMASPTTNTDGANKVYVDDAVAILSSSIAAVVASLTAGNTIMAVASLTAVHNAPTMLFPAGVTDLSSTEESITGLELASSATWINSINFWGAINGTTEDQYFFVTFSGAVGGYISEYAGTTSKLNGTLAIRDNTNVYAITKVGYANHYVNSDISQSLYTPFHLSAIVKVAAGETKNLYFAHKLISSGTVSLHVNYNGTHSRTAVRLR